LWSHFFFFFFFFGGGGGRNFFVHFFSTDFCILLSKGILFWNLSFFLKKIQSDFFMGSGFSIPRQNCGFTEIRSCDQFSLSLGFFFQRFFFTGQNFLFSNLPFMRLTHSAYGRTRLARSADRVKIKFISTSHNFLCAFEKV